MGSKEITCIIIIIGISILIGCLLEKSYLDRNRPLLSDRLELCESLGGRYRYYWGSYEQEYVEKCERVPGYIDLDQLLPL